MGLKIKLLAVVLVVCMFLVLVGCQGQPLAPENTGGGTTTSEPDVTAGGSEQAKKLKIGFTASDASLFNNMIGDMIKSYCDENSYEFIKTINNVDSNVVVSDVQSFINAECDYIYAYVIDEGTQETVREMCDKAEVTVVFVGMELEGYTTVAGDNYEGGAMCARHAWDKAKEIWDGDVDLFVAIQCTLYGVINTDRTGGMVDTFCELSGFSPDDVTWLDYDNILDTQTAFAAVLTAHPDAEHIVVLGVTDVNQLLGAWNAASAAGRQDQLIISGMHVADESTPGLLVQYPDIWVGQADLLGSSYGESFIEFVEAFEAGEDVKGTFKTCLPTWFDGTNVGEYYEVVF